MANSRKSSRRSAATAVGDVDKSAVDKSALDKSAVERPQPPQVPHVAAANAEPRPSVLQLGSSLSIREVGECAAQLKGLLAKGPTDIDASRLESIDTAGIQLLLAAAAAAQRRGFKLKLLGAHGLKSGAARSLGLAEHLGELAEILP
jgi:anti-anti-sigma regulatory factor